jgi:hypothetical protein
MPAKNLASCGADGLIDDGEDGNNQTKVVGGRGGYWYTFTEGHGTTVIPEAGEAGGQFAMWPAGRMGRNTRPMLVAVSPAVTSSLAPWA